MKHTIFSLLFIPQLLLAQLHDNTWLIGYQGGTQEFGITQFNFDTGNLSVEKSNKTLTVFAELNNCYSDFTGILQATFNGYWIEDKTGKKMKGGDSLWYTTEPNLFGYSDEAICQGGMFLPWPGHPDSLLLFYVSLGNVGTPFFVEFASLHLQYALIRLSGNNGLGEVQEKRNVVLADTIQYGRLSACKHANGRDWWILINEINSNRWYRYLLDPNGLHLHGTQAVGLPVTDGFSQSVFSPDGRHYATFNAITWTEDYLDIYDFDRCTGMLSNHRPRFFSDGFASGVSISPNSRYLYVSYTTRLYQYDLWASDVLASEALVGEYDGYVSTSSTVWDFAQLAPDGKIYICSPGSTKIVHVIHDPDEGGTACNFEQHGIHLPVYNAESVTTSPYFRLGPLDGSPCDSLDLDNHPKAWWRYRQDTLDILDVAFHDISYYEPDSWNWDFGDGTPGSTERHPQHRFDSAGVYEVCLQVSNANSSDTHCKTLYLGVSASPEPNIGHEGFALWPNPAAGQLSLRLPAPATETLSLRVMDLNGRNLLEKQLPKGAQGAQLELGVLPPGIYICTLTGAQGGWAAQKFVKQ